MPNILQPSLNGQQLTVDIALQTPRLIANRIAELAGPELVLDKFFDPGPAPVGGSYLFVQAKLEDRYLSEDHDVELRAPLTEYPVVEGPDPEPKMALVEDFGGARLIGDEERKRNLTAYLDNKVMQMKNSLVRTMNARALGTVDDVLGADAIVGHNWDAVTLVGPENALTPSAERPSADLSAAQLEADLAEMGVKHNLLIVHPNQANALRIAYGENLDAMLKSAGVELFSTPRVKPGVAYALQKGALGKVGFEYPLTVETYPVRNKRATAIQVYAAPYFSTENPGAVTKIIGLEA